MTRRRLLLAGLALATFEVGQFTIIALRPDWAVAFLGTKVAAVFLVLVTLRVRRHRYRSRSLER